MRKDDLCLSTILNSCIKSSVLKDVIILKYGTKYISGCLFRGLSLFASVQVWLPSASLHLLRTFRINQNYLKIIINRIMLLGFIIFQIDSEKPSLIPLYRKIALKSINHRSLISQPEQKWCVLCVGNGCSSGSSPVVRSSRDYLY